MVLAVVLDVHRDDPNSHWAKSEKSPLEIVSSVPEALYFDTSNG